VQEQNGREDGHFQGTSPYKQRSCLESADGFEFPALYPNRLSLPGSGRHIFLFALSDFGTATQERKIRRSPPGSRGKYEPKGVSLSVRTARLRASLLRRGRMEPGGLRRFSGPEPHATVAWFAINVPNTTAFLLSLQWAVIKSTACPPKQVGLYLLYRAACVPKRRTAESSDRFWFARRVAPTPQNHLHGGR
jgi:hypothetical protein